jgi:hypothetical protein
VNTRRQIVALYTFAAAGSRPTQICKRQMRGMQNLSDVQLQSEEEESGKRRICIHQSSLCIYFYLFSRPRPFISQRAQLGPRAASVGRFPIAFFCHRSLCCWGNNYYTFYKGS